MSDRPDTGRGVISSDGLRLLRAGLHGSRRPLTRLAAWSLVEASPALASGWVTAAAIDRGFLADRPYTGLAWLALLAVLYGARAGAERAMFPSFAAIVEPLRDHLVRTLVGSTKPPGRAAPTPPPWHA